MSFFSIFKSSPYGGYIKFFKLQSFWHSFSAEDRKKMKKMYEKSFYPNDFDLELIDSKNKKTKPEISVVDFLSVIGTRCYNQKEFSLAESCFEMAIKKCKDKKTIHELNSKLIDVLYKQRSEKEDALDKCVETCLSDIQLVQKMKTIKNKEVASFKRLAIIYEQKSQYDDAIKISEVALKHGISDGTKGGFQSRIEKLKSKAN